ncbi:MAG: 4-hydroxybenzoate octaprenyltransferase [Burkholderiaceae bacterium]|nr:4-hydroxybenzoate octaprenyltransferase [Burkholderiaceae bacterium]
MTPAISDRLVSYALLVRLHRPIGTLLLLWPTLWALFIAADGAPDPYMLFAFCLGTLLMRSAGCAINDFADRDFDRHVKRTRDRPVTTGRIRPWEAVAVFAILSLLALVLIIPFNTLTWQLAFVAAFIAGSYPFTKRFFPMPQAYLGIAFGFGIPMAFAAVHGFVPTEAWLMLLANVFWAIAYDTEYAMVDRDDDIHLGLRSSALTFGRFDVAAVMLCYAATLGLLGVVGARVGFGWPYATGLAVAALMAVHHGFLIRDRQREGCFRAFNLNNWLGAAIMLGVLAEYVLPG